MLSEPYEKWNIKFGKTSDDPLPGEKKISSTNLTSGNPSQTSLVNYENVSSFQKAIRVAARIIGIARSKSFRGGHIDNISTETFRQAEKFLLLDAQKEIDLTVKQYKTLNPT